MKPSRLLSTALAVLVLTGPGAARGQEASGDTPAEAPSSEELTPPPLVPVPPPGTPDSRHGPPPGEPPRAPSGPDGPSTSVDKEALPSRAAASEKDPVPRVAVELVGGTTGGLAAGTVGVLVGYLLAAPTVGCNECRIVSLVGGATGLLLGIPAGTWVGGRLMGGEGRFISAAGGSLVGWGGALLGSLLLGASSEDDTLALLLLALPLAGATTGYELSHAAERRAAAPPADRTAGWLRVFPMAGMSERGPRLGLMGRF